MPDRFDAAADFQLESNSDRPWTYGYSVAGAVAAAYAFIPFDQSQVTKGGAQSWTMAAYNTLGTPTAWRNTGTVVRDGVAPGQLSLHPGPRPDGDVAILRFTVPADAVYKISGRFLAGDAGSTHARVVLNGDTAQPLQVFPLVDGAAVLALLPRTLRAGDRLDFVVGHNGSFNGCNTPVQVVIERSVVGFVLGGGGAKGNFQVGALQYLQRSGWRPDVICGTSVGSVNGLKLAEMDGTPAQGLEGLTALWLSLQDYRGFFEEEPWLTEAGPAPAALRQILIDQATRMADSDENMYAVGPLTAELVVAERLAIQARQQALLDAVAAATKPALAVLLASLASIAVLGPVSAVGLAVAGVMIGELVNDVAKLIGSVTTTTSIFNLNPTRRLALQSLDLGKIARWADAGGRLRIATVGLVSGNVHIIDERGRLFDRDGVPFMDGRQLDTACRPLLARVRALGMELRRQRVAAHLNDAAAQAVEELMPALEAAQQALQACIALHPSAPRPLAVGLVDAMIASSTIPFFFPPMHLGNDAYVDGGLREVIPLQSALDCDANTVFAIQASRTAISLETDSVASNLGTIALRSTLSIAIDEVAYSDVRPLLRYSQRDIQVIEPRVDIHTTFTIYPAFIRNRIAYGYMCAADLLNPPVAPGAAQRCRDISDRIALLRYGCARLECWRSGQPVPPSQTVVPLPAGGAAEVRGAIATMKAEIATLVDERTALGGAMPPLDAEWGNAPAWSIGDEVHPWAASGGDEDATITVSGVPDTMAPGSVANIEIIVTNTGRRPWLAQAGDRLVFRPGLGLADAPVLSDVASRASLRLAVMLTAPAPPHADFDCQMVNGQGQRFGGKSALVRITVVAPNEPARCAQIRQLLRDARQELADKEAELPTGTPRGDAAVRREMLRINQRITDLTSEGQTLACAL